MANTDSQWEKPPGSGKTSTAATAALALQAKVGKVLCSGPTDTAVDGFAYRLEKHTRDVTEKLSAGKSIDESNRYRRKLVVRPYSFDQELNAFRSASSVSGTRKSTQIRMECMNGDVEARSCSQLAFTTEL